MGVGNQSMMRKQAFYMARGVLFGRTGDSVWSAGKREIGLGGLFRGVGLHMVGDEWMPRFVSLLFSTQFSTHSPRLRSDESTHPGLAIEGCCLRFFCNGKGNGGRPVDSREGGGRLGMEGEETRVH